MRNIAYGFILLFLFFLTIAIVLSNHGRNVRISEMNDSLSSAVEQSLDNVMSKHDYDISDKEQFVADFTESLLLQIDSKSKITVNVIKADTEKGLLSLEIVEEFTYPNGKIGSVSYNKTAIFDTKDNPNGKKEEHEYHEVTLYVKPNPNDDYQEYKKYTLASDETLTIKQSPSYANAKFLYWEDENGNKVQSLEDKTMEQDLNLYAVMEYSRPQDETVSETDNIAGDESEVEDVTKSDVMNVEPDLQEATQDTEEADVMESEVPELENTE